MDNKIRFFNPGLGYKKIKKEVDKAMQEVLIRGDLILRKDVEEFEQTLANYVGTKYAVALNSCTDALYLALKGLKIGQGDEVLVPSRTFVASVQVIVQVGATPVYMDMDNTFTLTEKTKAIIPVHIEGDFWDREMDILIDICRRAGIYIIEDVAQALGAIQNKKVAGSFGDAGCFSFYPAKILGAYGDAGALTTDNKELYEYVKGARNHFKEDSRAWGINSRMDNLQAAVLNVKFKYHKNDLQRRKEIAEMYSEGLKEIEAIQLPPQTKGRVWQDFIIQTEKRNGLFEFLKEKKIETMKNNYPFPVPKLPMAQKYEDETLRLPCNELLKDKEVRQVIKIIKEFYEI